MNFSFLKRSVLVLFGMVGALSTYGQDNPTSLAAKQNVESLANAGVGRAYDNRYQGVVGNPYYLDVWVPGSIDVKQSNLGSVQTFSNVKLKYDVHANQVAVVVQETKDTLLMNTNVVTQFNLMLPPSEEPVLFKRYKEATELDPKLADAFFAVLHDGKVDFLKRVSKSLIKADFKGGYSAGRTSDELVDELNYYVVSDNKMEKIKLNKKALLKALPQHEDKLESYIKSENLSMRSEEDFVKAIAYLDSL